MPDDVRSIARSYFPDGTSPAHDWHHVERVVRTAATLVAESPEADARVVRLAALLHDIGRAREDAGEVADHAEWGADEATRVLESRGEDPETVAAVAHCVRAHRFSNDVAPATLEAKLLSDADNLDALGAVGVARCFAHGGELGSPIYDPDLPPDEDETAAGRTQYNHLQKKLLALPDRMYTEAGRRRAEERAAFVRSFADRLSAEAAGER